MIKVMDSYVIDTDGKQYIGGKLATRKVKKDNAEVYEEYIKDPFYYNTFAGCVKAIAARVRMEAISKTDGNLNDAIKAIQAADEHLMKNLRVFDEIEVTKR